MKSAKITFKSKELIYDIENCSFVEGDIMVTDNDHARHQVFDIAQKGNIDRVYRMLNLAYSECIEMLYPYSKREIPIGQTDFNNDISAPDEYSINLSLPDGFSESTLRLVTNLLHEYMVCKVLADWMSIVNPSSKSNWEDKIDKLRQKIQTSLTARIGKVRRKTKPF
ncbi:MAG: hypothetical protein SNI70_09530 [Rikenellaceae bacterium]